MMWNNVKGLSIHHTATEAPASQDHSKCEAQAESIARGHARDGYHLDDGSLENGQTHYNALFCPHGERVGGRGLGSSSDANGNGNDQWYAVAFLGRYPRMSVKMEQALRAEVTKVENHLMNGGIASLIAHRDLTQTSCPGAKLARWIENYNKEEVMGFSREQKDWLERLADNALNHDVKPWQVRDAAQERHDKDHTHEGGAHTHEATVTLS